jgi:hypothetical protein
MNYRLCQRESLEQRFMGEQLKIACNVQDLLKRTDVEELDERLKETRVAVSMCGVTILRYITDAASRLPVSMLSRLLVTNDTLMALVPLADSPPWKREHNGAFEELNGSQWVKIAAHDRFKLSNTDAQVAYYIRVDACLAVTVTRLLTRLLNWITQ